METERAVWVHFAAWKETGVFSQYVSTFVVRLLELKNTFLRLLGKVLNEGEGEVRIPDARLIKCAESNHHRGIQHQHWLLGSTFSRKTRDDTKFHFALSSIANALSNRNITKFVHTIADCPREITTGTNVWNCNGRKRNKPGGEAAPNLRKITYNAAPDGILNICIRSLAAVCTAITMPWKQA